MFMVPTDAPGLEIRGIETMGGREVNDLFFTDCLVPATAVVGEVDNGWRQLMAGLNLERLMLGGLMLGSAQRAFDDTLGYVKERKQFGKPVGSFQALRHRIADLATEIECCRLLVYDVAARSDADPQRMLPARGLDGQAQGHRNGEADGAGGHADDGWVRLRPEFDMEMHVRRRSCRPSTAAPARSSATSSARPMGYDGAVSRSRASEAIMRSAPARLS